MSRAVQLAFFFSILALFARLIWIDQSFSDNWSWRQSDVAAIARNFYDTGFHFSRPQIDWAGDQPGYVGTEFPILPFAAAGCYRVVGVHEWVGRLQAVVFFAISIPFFFLLVREISGELAAVWALFFYEFSPLAIFTSREFIPDIPSFSLAIIGLYCFLRWLGTERSTFFYAAAIAISFALLIKLTTAIIGVPLACLAWQKWRWNLLRQPSLWIFAAMTLIPSVLWYWHAYDIALKFYPHHFFGAGGVRVMGVAWYLKIARQIVISSLTLPLFILASIGLFVGKPSERARLFYCWLGAMLVFIVVVGYGNRHQWYQLPLIPIAAAFAGSACAFLTERISPGRPRVASSILVIALFGFCAFFSLRPLYLSRASVALRDLGLTLKTTTAPSSLIVAADIGDPTVFYYAERTGWHFLEKDGIFEGDPISSEQAIDDLETLRRRGATHLVFTWATVWWLDYYKEFAQHLENSATLMQKTPEFTIYQLKPLAK